jgi:hypothetical protein
MQWMIIIHGVSNQARPHSIVSGTYKQLKTAGFLAGRAEFAVRYTVN